MLKDIMVDIETLGTTPGCVTLSIGAVAFNPQGSEMGEEFYNNLDVEDSTNMGFFTDPNTVAWWSKQSQEAKDHLVPNQLSVVEALQNFVKYFKSVGGEKIWCHGATFDAPILEHALKHVGIKVPWKYYNVRDTRTVFDLFQFDIRNVPRDGTYHNALADAKHQAICIQKALGPRS